MAAIQTQDLTGAALDWAVAKCEGWIKGDITHPKFCRLWRDQIRTPATYPSTNWAQGGPIIEREGLLIRPQPGRTTWDSWLHGADNPCYTQGPTPLIAAMRCFVASKLGTTVEMPEELAQ